MNINTECVFPVTLDRLWKLLRLHSDEKQITVIHPAIISSKITREEGETEYNNQTLKTSITFERKLNVRGRTWSSTWKYIQSPPKKFRVEVIAGEGPLAAGSYHESIYSEVSGGTLVSTKGEWIIQGLNIPKFLHGWMVKRELEKSDKEDYDYLQKANL
ncbi:MAG: hypothetical protein HY619_01770 [Thaumarchaeota archaeon]|nr:hypothetical protein [Nitrososphaerota archaeon]